jgi:DNA-binding MarR family transcriptional regulator
MTTAERTAIINDFLASMHIFSSAIDDLMLAQLDDELGGELTIPQLKLLKLIARTETESISEIATFLGVSNAAASKAVDRLVRRGLVERVESIDDRRATRLSLSVKGTFLLKRYEDVQNKVLEGLFRQFMAEDFVETAELLDQLSADLVKEGSGPRELCFRCGIYFRERCLLRNQHERTCYCNLKKRKKGDGDKESNTTA